MFVKQTFITWLNVTIHLFYFVSAVYTKSLCHLMDVMSGPLMQCLENRLERNQRKMEALQLKKEALLKELDSK